MCKKNPVALVAFILVIVGALNWGLVGIGTFIDSNLNVVSLLLGSWPTVEAVVYILVGLAAVYKLAMCKSCCGSCDKKSATPPPAAPQGGGQGGM